VVEIIDTVWFKIPDMFPDWERRVITPSMIREAKYGPMKLDERSKELARAGQEYHRRLFSLVLGGGLIDIDGRNVKKEVTVKRAVSFPWEVKARLDVVVENGDGRVVVEGKMRRGEEKIDAVQAVCIAIAGATIRELFFCYGHEHRLVHVNVEGLRELQPILLSVAGAALAFLGRGGQRMSKSQLKEELLGNFNPVYDRLVGEGMKFFGVNGK